jgi:hypothetical protein
MLQQRGRGGVVRWQQDKKMEGGRHYRRGRWKERGLAGGREGVAPEEWRKGDGEGKGEGMEI